MRQNTSGSASLNSTINRTECSLYSHLSKQHITMSNQRQMAQSVTFWLGITGTGWAHIWSGEWFPTFAEQFPEGKPWNVWFQMRPFSEWRGLHYHSSKRVNHSYWWIAALMKPLGWVGKTSSRKKNANPYVALNKELSLLLCALVGYSAAHQSQSGAVMNVYHHDKWVISNTV